MTRAVLVTGASKGLGAAIAGALGAQGFEVVVHYRSDRAGASPQPARPTPAIATEPLMRA
jgi:3-oxoacyl-[acyl-carrier protein] reductase